VFLEPLILVAVVVAVGTVMIHQLEVVMVALVLLLFVIKHLKE
jgi:hypothetical protein